MMFGNNPGTNETWKRIPENSIGAELGVWKGDSSAKFLKKAKHLYLVDAWSPAPYQETDEFGSYEAYLKRYSELTGEATTDGFFRYYDKIYESVKKRFADKPVTIHRMSTKEWFQKFNQKLDWIYVDASHSYEGCLFDLQGSWKKIKVGGSLFCDDYSDKKLGVKNAINTFCKDNNLKLDNFYFDQVQIVKTK